MKPKGLGKGLGALIADAEREISETQKDFLEIDVNLIDVCKSQPRKNFDQEKLTELADSIKIHGVIQPLILNKKGTRYSIIAGERRYRAARMAGLSRVPAVIKEVEARDVLQLSIIENIQREDLNPMEEANAIAMLMNEYSFTQEKVAEGIGRSRSAVANILRLLLLPPAVVAYVESGELSAGHARALLPLRDETRIRAAAEYVLEHQLSVRDAEQYVKRLLSPEQPTAKPAAAPSPELALAEKELSEAMETRIRLAGSPKRGKLIIEYYSREQLDQIYAFLLQAKK